MSKTKLKNIFFVLGFLCGIQLSVGQNESLPAEVVVKKVKGVYNFYVNGEPFKIKGAGINFNDGHNYKALAKAGGNAFRTWGTYKADVELKAAKKYNLKVALGIDIGKELYGFDYNDTKAVEQQFERVKEIVKEYKNHPSLLCWVIGNETNLLFEEDGTTLKMVNTKVYDAIAEIVDYIHQEDPNHPVTTTFAGVIKNHLKIAMKKIPDLDIVSVQVYGDLENVEELMNATGIKKPYMITEFGPRGFWEMPKTEWNREIEEVSGPKADGIAYRIEKGIINNRSGQCLGGFAFEWGQKQERTPTWYGMFHKDGSQTETIDVLTKIWTGSYPENRAPRVDKVTLNDRIATDNIYLKPGKESNAYVKSKDPDGDTLRYVWKVLYEVEKRSQGGELEIEPEEVPIEIIKHNNAHFSFLSPKKEGAYRLFVYVYDQKGKVGGGNIPFYVKK